MSLSRAPTGLRAAVRSSIGIGTAASADDEFGYSVAVSGQTAVIGAPDEKSNRGAAYVFVRSGSKWSRQAKLTASDAPGDEFGWSVAINGSTVVVGAPGEISSPGAAYVFVRSGTSWSQQQELTASDGAANDNFGYSVAVSGQTAVVGAPFKNSQTGAAYVFARSGTRWFQKAEVSAAKGAAGDLFGVSVAVSGSTAVVGSSGGGSGAAYVFMRSGAAWPQQAKLTASGTDGFGSSVGLSGHTALAGAAFTNSNKGAAFVFVRSDSKWSRQQKLTP